MNLGLGQLAPDPSTIDVPINMEPIPPVVYNPSPLDIPQIQFGPPGSAPGAPGASLMTNVWADVISADAFEAFTEAKGPYDKNIAKKLLVNVFSIGNTMDQEEAYKKFRGRKPKIDALMRARNFPLNTK